MDDLTDGKMDYFTAFKIINRLYTSTWVNLEKHLA